MWASLAHSQGESMRHPNRKERRALERALKISERSGRLPLTLPQKVGVRVNVSWRVVDKASGKVIQEGGHG